MTLVYQKNNIAAQKNKPENFEAIFWGRQVANNDIFEQKIIFRNVLLIRTSIETCFLSFYFFIFLIRAVLPPSCRAGGLAPRVAHGHAMAEGVEPGDPAERGVRPARQGVQDEGQRFCDDRRGHRFPDHGRRIQGEPFLP